MFMYLLLNPFAPELGVKANADPRIVPLMVKSVLTVRTTLSSKAPCKQMEHFWRLLYMLHPFGHPVLHVVACCWELLHKA